ncbi:hypothetical protein CR513_60121, partial [Mucuna pruriens]
MVNFDFTHNLGRTELFLSIRNNLIKTQRESRRESKCRFHFRHNKRHLFIVQNLQHSSHGRPLSTIRVCTTQPQKQKLLHFPFLKLPIQPSISCLNDPPLGVQAPNPIHQIHHLVLLLSLNWPPPTSHLKHHHPIAEHISLLSCHPTLKILRSKKLGSPLVRILSRPFNRSNGYGPRRIKQSLVHCSKRSIPNDPRSMKPLSG